MNSQGSSSGEGSSTSSENRLARPEDAAPKQVVMNGPGAQVHYHFYGFPSKMKNMIPNFDPAMAIEGPEGPQVDQESDDESEYEDDGNYVETTDVTDEEDEKRGFGLQFVPPPPPPPPVNLLATNEAKPVIFRKQPDADPVASLIAARASQLHTEQERPLSPSVHRVPSIETQGLVMDELARLASSSAIPREVLRLAEPGTVSVVLRDARRHLVDLDDSPACPAIVLALGASRNLPPHVVRNAVSDSSICGDATDWEQASESAAHRLSGMIRTRRVAWDIPGGNEHSSLVSV